MKKSISILTAVILCIAAAAISFIAAYVTSDVRYRERIDELSTKNAELKDKLDKRNDPSASEVDAALEEALETLDEAKTLVDSYYVFREGSEFAIDNDAIEASIGKALYDITIAGKVLPDDVKPYLLNAYFNAIPDPFTMYHTTEEMKELMTESEGRIYGIGVYVIYDIDANAMCVTHVMPDSPAEKAGIVPGDRITAVEGLAVSEETYNECIDRVKGELGTKVRVTVRRDGKETDIFPVRGEVRAKAVYSEYVGDYAWVTIVEFSGLVAEDFEEAIKEAEKKGVKGYIFDMRDNPGGDLEIICSVLDRLLPKGPIVNIINSDGQKAYERSSDAKCVDKPMVVLCNGNTASAGELFTSALRDYEKATIIGTTTYGKGTMQNIITLSDGSGVRVSSHYYNPPFSENYHLRGITPDIVIENTEYMANRAYLRGTESDTQFTAAIEELDRLCNNK